MANLNEQIGFLRGLIGGMGLEPDSANAKLFAALTDALESIAGEIGDMRDDLQELNDFVESIDEDLEDLEAVVDGDERDLDFPGEDEDYDEDYEDESYTPEGGLRVIHSEPDKARGEQALAGSICPDCGKLFFVPLDSLDDENELFKCPHCQKPVIFAPLGPENAPVAEPYRE